MRTSVGRGRPRPTLRPVGCVCNDCHQSDTVDEAVQCRNGPGARAMHSGYLRDPTVTSGNHRLLVAALVRKGQYGPWAVRLVVARCEVLYTGRLTARLPEAVRLLTFKAHGSFLVHDDAGGFRPLNWMTPPTVFEEEQSGRASCRERAKISVVAGSLKKKTKRSTPR